MKSRIIEFEITEKDFEETFGRKPLSEGEFSTFCLYCERGIEVLKRGSWKEVYKSSERYWNG